MESLLTRRKNIAFWITKFKASFYFTLKSVRFKTPWSVGERDWVSKKLNVTTFFSIYWEIRLCTGGREMPQGGGDLTICFSSMKAYWILINKAY